VPPLKLVIKPVEPPPSEKRSNMKTVEPPPLEKRSNMKTVEPPPLEKRSNMKTKNYSNTSEDDEATSDIVHSIKSKSRSRTYDSRRKNTPNPDEPPAKKSARNESLVAIKEEETLKTCEKVRSVNTVTDNLPQKVSSQKNGSNLSSTSSLGSDFSIEALTTISSLNETKTLEMNEKAHLLPESSR